MLDLCSNKITLIVHNIFFKAVTRLFLSFFILYFPGAYAAKEFATPPQIFYSTSYFGKSINSPSIGELVTVANEALAEFNARCVGGWCSNALFSTQAISRGGPLVNGLPGYYDVGENTGIQWNDQTGEVYNAHVAPLTVKVNQVCAWPSTPVTQNGTMNCVLKFTEANGCGAGNPIDIAIGNKYEQEVDYASADGALKVERFYVDQNTGWVIGRPITLKMLRTQEQFEYPEYSYKQYVEYTKSILGSSATIYPQLLYPPFINPHQFRVAIVWDGRKMLRFTEVSTDVFSPDNLDSMSSSLTKYNSPEFPTPVWRLVLRNQDVHYINGKLLRSEFANGNVITYEYTNERLSARVDQNGRRLAYTYDTDGRLITITQPDNNTITYTYGTDKQAIDFKFLKKVTWSNGESISYLYNEPANLAGLNTGTVALTGKLDTNGQRIGNYKYNGSYAVLTEGYSGIKKKQLTFNAYSTTVTDALNSSRVYYFYQPTDKQRFVNGTSQPAGSGCSASTKSAEYYLETDLKKVEADFNGNKQQFAYNQGRKLETVRVEGVPKSDLTDYLPDGKVLAAGIRKISTQWHSQWRSPVKKAEPRLLTTSIYNGDVDPFNGNQIANCSSYTSIPLLCHQVQQATTDVNGQSGLSAVLDTAIAKREWVYTYNARGQLLTRKRVGAAVTDETREYYDVLGTDYRVGDLKSITNALGHKIQFTAYDGNGFLKKALDANNVESQFTYDARGRLLTQTTAQATTTHSYDVNGNRNKTIFPNGMVVNYEYDPAKRLVSISNVAGEKINYEYDLESNLRYERITNSGGAVTYLKEHIYDALSREKNLVNSISQSRTYLYDANGNSIGETDAKQQTTSRTFDALNQLSLSTNALNGVTNYTYDKQGRITEVKDPKNHSTIYTYNAFGELTQQVSPDTGTTTFTYDAAGNRTSATDARSVVMNYGYDALNRLKTVSYPAAATENITYTYDSIANGSYGVGRLASVSTAAARNDYEYNSKGLISKKFTQVGTLLSTTQYTYDAAGQLSTIVYPSGRSVTYARDSQGRVQSISTKTNANATAQTVVANLAYLPFGPVSSYSYGNGLTHANSFDTDYRLTNIQVGTVLSRSFGYDANSNISAITNVITATKNQTFGYDALDRLTSATGIYGSLNYTYDAVGNRLTEKVGTTTATYNYETTSNRLSGITSPTVTRAFAYDNAGNRTQGTTEDNKIQNYTYNKANRLSTAKVGTTLVGTYTYNALGQRVSKVAGSTKEFYQYDEAGQLLAVTDAAGVVLREYIYNDSQLVGFVKNQILYYVHNDHLGTPQVVTNQTKAVVFMADYQPFGKLQPGQVNSIELYSRFPGQYLDSETGLYYNYFRDYDSSIGRYIESDPVGLGGGINTYAYVGGNPMMGIDPKGLWIVGAGGAVVGGLTGAAGSIIAQLIQHNGDWNCINWGNVGFSSATGALGGFLLTTGAGTTIVGVASIGGFTNLLNYGLTTSPSSWSTSGAAWAFGSGAVGGLLGGKTPDPYWFIKPSPSLNDLSLAGQITGLSSFGTNSLGATVGGYDYTSGLPSSSPCGCGTSP